VTEPSGAMVAFPLPPHGRAFEDVRRDGRILRVTWHADDDVVVLSLWRGSRCTGTFRLPVDAVPDLVATLSRGAIGAR